MCSCVADPKHAAALRREPAPGWPHRPGNVDACVDGPLLRPDNRAGEGAESNGGPGSDRTAAVSCVRMRRTVAVDCETQEGRNPTMSDRQQLEDVGFMTCMTLDAARQLRPDRTFRRPAGLHAVQRRRRTWPGPSAAGCATTTGGPSIPTATSSCSPPATARRPATRCG